ncbi:MAG: orotidine-5'-phosphate decarboxylase [Armatimonadota bacterium]|nr:orotidine-5'-phosphate decarboxylase [Armatimonadota bacterium]
MPALIVALDVPGLREAAGLVECLRPVTCWFKIGPVLFVREGPAVVRMVHDAGGHVFLDLKLHDIPQSAAGGVAAAAELGAALVTVHCAGGETMLRAAAAAARPAAGRMAVLGVTRLTSEAGRVAGSVLRAARLAQDAGLDGVTAAVAECARIKAACGQAFRVLTPAIRPAGGPAHDQARVATPAAAVRAGSDYLVVGRPITAATDPVAAARAVAAEMEAAGGASGPVTGSQMPVRR